MKVIHIESGLGNQMLSYCEYLALKSANPDDDFYLETIIYEIPECGDVICQWNGYELNKIFGIEKPKNIKSLFSKNEWDKILQEVRQSKFWEKNWNYPPYIVKALNNAGLHLENIRGDFGDIGYNSCNTNDSIRHRLLDSRVGHCIKDIYTIFFKEKEITKYDNRHNLFMKSNNDLFTGQWLSFCRKGNDREKIDTQIHEVFKFPIFTDVQDIEFANFISSCDSIAIHVRRGDALYSNAWCYKYGYFRRAVKYLRKHVNDPVFVFFTDPDSVNWCKINQDVFGINMSSDKVFFVDWHKGLDSFRDMQLMSYCKHAIITTSSFGWWGAYFISNPQKITVSPYVSIDTTYHC